MELNDVVSASMDQETGEVTITKVPAKDDAALVEKTDETNTKTSAVEETEDDVSDETEDSESDAEEQSEAEQGKKSGVEKRIEKLLKRETAAKREADDLRQRLAALEARSQPKQEAEPEPEVVIDIPEPKPEDYDSHAAYVKALVKHEREVEAKTVEVHQGRQQMKAAQEKAQAHLDEAFARGAEKYDDYNEVVRATKDQPTVEMVQFLLETEQPEEVVYYLSKNADEYNELRKLKGPAAFRAMARLETKLANLGKQENAAPPIKPVGEKAPRGTTLRDDLDTDSWLQRRKEQMKGKRYR